MNRVISICLLIVSFGTIACIAAAAPRWLDDSNRFLKAFVGHELLSILGIILAITLASASQIHLKFNDIEEKAGKNFLEESRNELATSAYALIASFFVAIILVSVKSLFVDHGFGIAFVNGLALWLLLFNLLILLDITVGIFSIGPFHKN